MGVDSLDGIVLISDVFPLSGGQNSSSMLNPELDARNAEKVQNTVDGKPASGNKEIKVILVMVVLLFVMARFL